MANMNVMERIQHYQRSIERCNNNETEMLHCIDSLYYLPVTVQHWQETGVGRTVNALRKLGGIVGNAATALVAKWKTMVVDEETSDEDEACVPDASEGYSDRSNSPKVEKDNGDDRNSSKSVSHRTTHGDKTRTGDKQDSRHGTKHSSTLESSKSDSKTTKNGTDKSHAKTEARGESRSEKKSKVSRDSKRESGRSEKEAMSCKESSTAKSRTKDETRKDSSRVSSSSGSGSTKVSSQDSHRKRKSESSHNDRKTSKRRRSDESPIVEATYEIPTQVLPRASDVEPLKILPDTSVKMDTETFKEPKEKKDEKKKINGDGGIDCTSGASFAEALGMCAERPAPRKKASPVSSSSSSTKAIKSIKKSSSGVGKKRTAPLMAKLLKELNARYK